MFNQLTVSIPVLPYPRLLERECDHAGLLRRARKSPPYGSGTVEAETDIFFLGSPTSSVRERLQKLKASPSSHGSGGGSVRWNVTVIHSKTRKIHSMKASERVWTCANECQCLDEHAVEHHERQRRATFGLVPRGHGVYSFRLTEVLLAGSIPVILSNGWVLPFSEALDWDSFSVRLDEEAVMANPEGALTKLVTDITPACAAAMRRRAHDVAAMFFSTAEGTARGLAAVLASRALGCGGGRGQALGRDRSGANSGPAPLCLADRAGDSAGGPRSTAPLDEWEASVGSGVRLGAASVCLPKHLRSSSLPTRVFMQETVSLRVKSQGHPPGVLRPFNAPVK